MNRLLLLAAILPYLAQAALDRIDADGVTETGGTAAYARMLPRTKADGRLDATLLPPVADWASQPLPGLYYLSDGADHEGNGSPQYPFKTLTNAWAHAASGSAVLVAPGTYAGVVTLPSGQIRTLYGFGRSSFVQSLTVLSVGSATNELRLCGLRVGTLTLNGGPVTLSLQGATVGTLAGAASGITVARLDLGALVGASAVDYTDVHAGHQTVPKANRLVNPERTLQLDLTAGRGVVTATGGGTETLAYLSDLSTATNALGTEIRALASEDVRLAGLVTSEASARRSSDAVLSNQTVAAAAVLQAQVDAIGTTWNTQAATLASGLSSVRSALSTLSLKEADDVADLEDAIADVRSDYAVADTTLAGTLRSETASSVSTLRADVPNIADERANVQISLALPGIVDAAAGLAVTNISGTLSSLTGRVSSLETSVTRIDAAVAGNTSDVIGLKAADVSLWGSLASLRRTESNDVAVLTRSVESAVSGYVSADAALDANLRVLFAQGLTALSNNMPVVATAVASSAITAASPGIIASAVSQAGTAMESRVGGVETDMANLATTLRWETTSGLNALSNAVTPMANRAADNRISLATPRLISLASADAVNMVTPSITSVRNDFVASDRAISNMVVSTRSTVQSMANSVTQLTSWKNNTVIPWMTTITVTNALFDLAIGDLEDDVADIQTWQAGIATWKTGIDGTKITYHDKINEIIDWLASISNKVQKATVPKRLP